LSLLFNGRTKEVEPDYYTSDLLYHIVQTLSYYHFSIQLGSLSVFDKKQQQQTTGWITDREKKY